MPATSLPPKPPTGRRPPPAAPTPVDLPPAERTWRAVGAAFAWGGLVARALGYALLWAIAERQPFGGQFLAGVLAGDLMVWAFALACAWREPRAAVAVESLALLGFLWLGWRHWSLPREPELLAIFGLAAFGAMVGRLGAWSTRRLDGDRAEA